MDQGDDIKALKDKILQLQEKITGLKHAENALKKERDFIFELL